MNSHNHLHTRWHWFILLCCFSLGSQAAGPKVVVSILPIHSLVAGIMQGIGEPELLISGQQSPHHFSLKPSDMRAIQQAQLIVWVGPDMETSLSHILENGTSSAQVVTLSELETLPLLTTREGDAWDAHEHSPRDHAHGDAESESMDSHLWLSPVIAGQIVQQVTDTLVQLDSAHADRYEENRQTLLLRLEDLDAELSNRLTSVRDEPYIVFHDAYHYFEQRYQLNAVGSVSINPERMPGARRVYELREKIGRLHARCIFAEPQFEPKLVQTLAEGSDAKTGQLDPLGSDLPAGPEAYFQLMRRLSQNLIDCLK